MSPASPGPSSDGRGPGAPRRTPARPHSVEPTRSRSAEPARLPEPTPREGAVHARMPAEAHVLAGPVATPAEVFRLQALAGNRAVAGHLQRLTVQREATTPTSSELDAALDAKDKGKVKGWSEFPHLTQGQLTKIVDLITDTWVVGPVDEATLEAAWRAYGPEGSLTEKDHDLWVRCLDRGVSPLRVPWIYELRTQFAQDTRDHAYRTLETNDQYLKDEATTLGVAVDGGGKPAEPAVPAKTQEQQVEDRQKAARLIRDLQRARAALLQIECGYAEPEGHQQADQPMTPSGTRVKFNPDAPPPGKTNGNESPPMARYEELKAADSAADGVISAIASTSPALFAMLAQGNLDAFADATDTSVAQAQVAATFAKVLAAIKETRAKLEPPGADLPFQHLKPVHERLFTDPSKPRWGKPFAKAEAQRYVEDEKGSEAQMQAALGIAALVLLITISIASGGSASIAVTLLSDMVQVGASAASAGMSWEKANTLATAASTTTRSDLALVDKGEADSAQAEAVRDTIFALVDVYGAGKGLVKAAMTGMEAKAALAGLRATQADVSKLRGLEQLSVAERETTLGAAIERDGVAATLAKSGKSAQDLLALVSKEGAAGTRLGQYVAMLAKNGGAALKELAPRLGKLTELTAKEADEAVSTGLEFFGPGRTLEMAGGFETLQAKVGHGAPSLARIETWRDGLKRDLGTFLEERRAGSRGTGAATDVASKSGAMTSSAAATAEDLQAARAFVAARSGVGASRVDEILQMGLASAEQLEKYAAAGPGVHALFESAATREARAEALLRLVNERLGERGIPPATYGFQKEAGASFEWKEWRVNFNDELLRKPRLEPKEFTELLEHAYHEARHGEQFFMMARAQAGDEATLAFITKKLGLPEKVARLAHDDPLWRDAPGFDDAMKWFESIYGAGKEARSVTLKTLTSTEKDYLSKRATQELAESNYKEVQAALQGGTATAASKDRALARWSSATTEADAAYKPYEDAFKAYKDLPEEADAWKVTEMIQQRLKGYRDELDAAERELQEAQTQRTPNLGGGSTPPDTTPEPPPTRREGNRK